MTIARGVCAPHCCRVENCTTCDHGADLVRKNPRMRTPSGPKRMPAAASRSATTDVAIAATTHQIRFDVAAAVSAVRRFHNVSNENPSTFTILRPWTTVVPVALRLMATCQSSPSDLRKEIPSAWEGPRRIGPGYTRVVAADADVSFVSSAPQELTWLGRVLCSDLRRVWSSMSRDLQVFAPRAASPHEVAELARGSGCVVEPDRGGWWFVVTNSAAPGDRFFVAEPDADWPEYLPPVVAHALSDLGSDASEPPCYFLQLPAGFADAWPIMVDTACAFADALGGAVFDPSDERVVWPERFADLEVPVAADVRIDTLDLSWYGSPAAERPGWARRILEIAESTFPEAVPAMWEQWGLEKKTKPRPFRWAEVEDFEKASTVSLVFWDANPPFLRGHLSRVTNAEGGNVHRYPSPFSDLGISLNAAALEDPERHRQLLDLVTRIADETQAVYAHAQLNRNMIYRDGEVGSGESSKPAGYHFADSLYGCVGLPPRVWLEWFGGPYLPYVTEALACIAHAAGSGLLAEYGRDEALRATNLPADLIQGPRGVPAPVVPRM
jgi:hypothetical protein